MSGPRYIQWLLVGGPADGQTIWVEADRPYIAVREDGGMEYEYAGHQFQYGGGIFRVGAIGPNDLLPSKVASLIRSSGLQPII
jgi:hypothetical protein